jgi:hypothetical protein
MLLDAFAIGLLYRLRNQALRIRASHVAQVRDRTLWVLLVDACMLLGIQASAILIKLGQEGHFDGVFPRECSLLLTTTLLQGVGSHHDLGLGDPWISLEVGPSLGDLAKGHLQSIMSCTTDILVLMDSGKMHHLAVYLFLRFRNVGIMILYWSQINLDVLPDCIGGSRRKMLRQLRHIEGWATVLCVAHCPDTWSYGCFHESSLHVDRD